MFSVGQKIANSSIAIFVGAIILMPDALFNFLLELGHLLIEFCHLLFEWTELSLDFLIELVFDTTLHQTQIVVFYIMAGALIYGLYKLVKRAIVGYENMKTKMVMAWILYKMQWVLYFKTMPTSKRLQWFAVGMGFVSYVVLFGF